MEGEKERQAAVSLEAVEGAGPFPEDAKVFSDRQVEPPLQGEAPGACGALVRLRLVDDVGHEVAFPRGVAKEAAMAGLDRRGVEVREDGRSAGDEDTHELGVEWREVRKVPRRETAPDDVEALIREGEGPEVPRGGGARADGVGPPPVEHLEDEVEADHPPRSVSAAEDEPPPRAARGVEKSLSFERGGQEKGRPLVEGRQRILRVVGLGPEAIGRLGRQGAGAASAQGETLRCP